MARDKTFNNIYDGVFSTSYPFFTIFKHSKKHGKCIHTSEFSASLNTVKIILDNSFNFL